MISTEKMPSLNEALDAQGSLSAVAHSRSICEWVLVFLSLFMMILSLWPFQIAQAYPASKAHASLNLQNTVIMELSST